MPLREWLKPPRTLLLILFLLTLVSVSALAWFGWRLLDQERLVEAQRAQEQREQTADRVAAMLRGILAETGERLQGMTTHPKDGLVLSIDDSGLPTARSGQLLYYPTPSALPEASAAVFSEAENLEFSQLQPEQALTIYQSLMESSDTAVRAGALLRQARVLRRIGRHAQSLAAYEQLAAYSSVKVAGVPAELVARLAICELTKYGRGDLTRDLSRGKWHLTRAQFRYYWAEAAESGPPPATAVALAEAAALAWRERNRETGGRRGATAWVEGQPFFYLWRGSTVLVTHPEDILKQALGRQALPYAAVDSDGRVLAGRKPPGRFAVRTAADSQLPWTLYVSGGGEPAQAGAAAQRRFLLLGIVTMVVFLLLGTYFIARAIRREIEVSRMQSDFVAAVSHEFRSPLTSMRQLSELLALGRIPSEDRRQTYYETLVREATRLQRLVEALLNFGRMEAGARVYRFEELDAAALVQRVVAEFEPQVAGHGRHIEWHGPPSRCPIEADPEAISVALRNLVDNAIKYSPDEPLVWVEWGLEDRYVAIRVRDKGIGIPASERKVIFRKFVRGSAAASRNVKGSGVGLAMVRHIVDAHGGEITVDSEPGQGSTFTMLLPAVVRP